MKIAYSLLKISYQASAYTHGSEFKCCGQHVNEEVCHAIWCLDDTKEDGVNV